MFVTASVSALPFSNVVTSTGMIIWAAIGLAGLLCGLVSVRLASRRNRQADAGAERPVGTTTAPVPLPNTTPVSADNVNQSVYS